MTKEEVLEMYLQASEEEKELIEAFLRGSLKMRSEKKVYKILETDGSAHFICFTREDAEEFIRQNKGKGMKIQEETAGAILDGKEYLILETRGAEK